MIREIAQQYITDLPRVIKKYSLRALARSDATPAGSITGSIAPDRVMYVMSTICV